MKTSAIGWTDYSGGNLNFVTGCTPASEGCRECYARRLFERFGRDFSQVTIYPEKLARLRTQAFPEWSPKRGAPHRPMLFPVDMGDLFHPDVPDAFIGQAFQTMAARRDVVWQVLTKRAERLHYLLYVWAMRGELDLRQHPHIWVGVTVENQAAAATRIPRLLWIPAAVRWVSVEPMLGPVHIGDANISWLTCNDSQEYIYDDEGTIDHECCESFAMGWGHFHGIDWVVCGAESGPNRRQYDEEWALALRSQCREAGVPFFYKQGSGERPGMHDSLPGVLVAQEWPHGA
jgi:protein gp37